MAPKREQKKRMGKKHRQASTRPKLGKGPVKGARKGSAVTGAVSPKQRKQIAAKQAAAAKAKLIPTRSPENEHRVIVGDMDDAAPRSKRADARASLASRVPAVSSNQLGEAVPRPHEPLVAICGRPNVGKSTLFNRFTGTRRSIVGDEPGITRDRIYGEVEWGGRTVRLVDTGGVIPDDEALIPSEIFRQARVALDEADAIIMVIDGRTEITGADQEFSRILMRGGKPLFLAVNKMDTAQLEAGAENFRTLGFRNVYPVSAEHGSGIGDLLDAVWEVLPAPAEEAQPSRSDAASTTAASSSTGKDAKKGHPAPEDEEPEEILDTQTNEAEEDEGDLLADRAVLEPRAILEDLLEGEAATADEPAGVDAPPVGQLDREPPTGGSGKEPKVGKAGPQRTQAVPEPSRTTAAILSAAKDLGISPAEIAELGLDEEEPQERKLRTHGEHIQRETKIAIIGRPNVGKSTLLNALTGTNRAIVSPIAGTTRDAVDEVVTRDGHDFRFIDTAGIRRKGKTTQMAEKLSVIMSRKHLEAADVALLMIDATEGVTGSDATIGGYAHESGRSVIIVVNKWDLVAPPKSKLNPDGTRPFDGKPPADKDTFEEQVRYSLKYLDYAPLVFISAADGKGVDQIFKKVELVARERRKRISTGNMNRFLDKVDFGRASVPMNKRVRIYYMTQAAVAPPTFVLFTDRDVKLHFSYERFLANEIRKTFKFIGSPIWFKIKARNKKKEE